MRYTLLLFTSLLLFSVPSFAQEGKFLQVWGGYQTTQLNNSQESYYGTSQDDQVSLAETDHPFFGADFIYNFHNLFGIQTGVTYSMQGQRYNGYIQHDANPRFKGDTLGGDSNVYYNSQVIMNYIKVPLMFRFNSGKDEETIFNFSIYAGIQFAYLWSVSQSTVESSPVNGKTVPDWLTSQPFDLKQLYNALDFEWVAGAQVNIFVSKHWGIAIGARYDRSLMNVETQSFSYDPNKQYPVEDYYPVSVKKSTQPSQQNQYTRFSSKNNTVGGYIGIIIPIGGMIYHSRPADEEVPQEQF